MNLRDFISKLQQFDPELTVAIADWQEEYCPPSEEVANQFYVQKGTGTLVIGDCDHCYHETSEASFYDPVTHGPKNGSKCCVCGDLRRNRQPPKDVCREGRLA